MRVMVVAAVLVCSVLSTRWPVSALSTAMSAVSRSRISPTMITSGSWRRKLRSAVAKVKPAGRFTCICCTSAMWYSTGSSMVRMLTCRCRISSSIAYSVVDLPQPVGPVARNMPWLRCISVSSSCLSRVPRPMSPSVRRLSSVSSRRITTLSPKIVGSTEKRRSTVRPSSSRKVLRPSWAVRCSARFMRPSTLRRLTSAGSSPRRKRRTGTSSLSMRNSRSTQSSPGRMWMSDARRSIAPAIMCWIMRTTGFSSASRSALIALVCRASPAGSRPSWAITRASSMLS